MSKSTLTMALLKKATGFPTKEALMKSGLYGSFIAYSTTGTILASASNPVELHDEVQRVKPGVKFFMSTRSAIEGQAEDHIGWVDFS